MPAVTSGKIVVTGANGYIAAWCTKTLLLQGYTVLGVVRSETAASTVKQLFSDFGARFEACIVPDYGKVRFVWLIEYRVWTDGGVQEGAFDEIATSIDAILHIASPCHFDTADPKDLIEPAIAGTVNVLRSCMRAGSTVKRVVITSSTAAVFHWSTSTGVLDESVWNKGSPREVELKGKETDPRDIYSASKTLAERAAWALIDQHRHDAPFDLVALTPPWVFGPTLTPQRSTLSLDHWRDAVLGVDLGSVES